MPDGNYRGARVIDAQIKGDAFVNVDAELLFYRQGPFFMGILA